VKERGRKREGGRKEREEWRKMWEGETGGRRNGRGVTSWYGREECCIRGR